MNRHSQPNPIGPVIKPIDSGSALELGPDFLLNGTSGADFNAPSTTEVRIASLKVLALSPLGQIESLEVHSDAGEGPELNLQSAVHQFEAVLIRSALVKTGGRQRRAARLLGVKVTTLNTKIKRH
jgi:DNA-binding NtrC family response regulator